MTTKENIYRMEMHTNPTVVLPGTKVQSTLTNEVFISLYSRETIEETDITEISLHELSTGRGLEEVVGDYAIKEIAREWRHPVFKGESDPNQLVCHLTLAIEDNGSNWSSIPDLTTSLHFTDGSHIGTWEGSEDGFPLSSPAFIIQQFAGTGGSENPGGMTEAEEIAEQEELVRIYGLDSYPHLKIASIDGRVWDDSASNDDLIYFSDNGGGNQRWQLLYMKEWGAFYIANMSNLHSAYESEQRGIGYKMQTLDIVHPSDDPHTHFRLLRAGIADDGNPLYKIKSMNTKNLVTIQSYNGSVSGAGNAMQLVTIPEFGEIPLLQKFKLIKA